MPSKLSDGLYIAVDKNGEVCCGANRSGPKLYVYESVAVKKAKAGGKVYRIDESGIKQIWPVAKTFFLNERHEIRDEELFCTACGRDKSRCSNFDCYGID